MKIFGRLRERHKEKTTDGIIGDMENVTKEINGMVNIEDIKDNMMGIVGRLATIDDLIRRIESMERTIDFRMVVLEQRMDTAMAMIEATTPALYNIAKSQLAEDIKAEDDKFLYDQNAASNLIEHKEGATKVNG